MLSVICPIYNEKKYIAECIHSIVAQDYPKDDMEVLFVDGMSDDGTRDIVRDFTKEYPYISLVDNPQRIVPVAMNIGIKASRGQIIIRLDAHAKYPADYFSTLTAALERLHADNVGVVCHTDVLNKSPKTLAIKEVLGNKFGVGNSSFRTGIKDVQEVDTVPFGCWRREVFDRYGLYDTRLVRNQDIELNKRIKRGGGHIFIIPDTCCTYMARETYKALARNNYGNGKWNILTVYYTGQLGSLSVRHFIPLAFVLSLLLPSLAALLFPVIGLVALVSLACYLSLLCGISIQLGVTKRLNVFYLLGTFVTLHLSYGWGSLAGILDVCRKRMTKK